MSLGFLYEGSPIFFFFATIDLTYEIAYGSALWWFELADMAHKLAMCALVVFFPADAQMPAAMIITAIYTILLLIRVCHPFVIDSHNFLWA